MAIILADAQVNTQDDFDRQLLGGSFGVDRVLANLGPTAWNEVNFQCEQLAMSIRTRFQDELIAVLRAWREPN